MNMKNNAKVLRELKELLYTGPKLTTFAILVDVETRKQRMVEILEQQQVHIESVMKTLASNGHEVEKDQSLQDITEYYFVERGRFGELYELNKDILNCQIENIKEGTILKLPNEWFDKLNVRKYTC